MSFELSCDAEGKPAHVFIDTGYMQTSRPYDPDEDGWMLDQLDPNDFPIIQAGRDMALLVKEVNRLRRELFYAKGRENVYRACSGFP